MPGLVILMISARLSSRSSNEAITIPSFCLITVTLYLTGLLAQLLSVTAFQVISNPVEVFVHRRFVGGGNWAALQF